MIKIDFEVTSFLFEKWVLQKCFFFIKKMLVGYF